MITVKLNRCTHKLVSESQVCAAMSLEFGLTLAGLGVLAMFSALVFIIIACEVLKRIFKEVEITPAEVPVEEAPLEREGERRAHEVRRC